MAKAVICLETGKIWPSIQDAARDLHICYKSISRCCNGQKTSVNNLSFKFYDETETK